jgi:hypothetical protein
MDARALPVGSLHTLMTKVGLGDAEDHMAVVSVTLFVTLLCACIVMGHLMEEYQWVSESVTAIILVSLSLLQFLYLWWFFVCCLKVRSCDRVKESVPCNDHHI